MPLHITKFLSHADRHQAQATVAPKRCLLAMLWLLCGAPALAAESDDVSMRLFDLQLSVAKKGDQAAQYYVAEMYEKGLGVAQNMDQALAWYKKSADQGYAPAKLRIDMWSKSTERNSMNTGKPAEEKADSGPVPAPVREAIEPEKTAHVHKPTKVDKPAAPTPAKQATVAVSKTEKKSAETAAVASQQLPDTNVPAKADARSVSMPTVTESDKTAAVAETSIASPAVSPAAPKNATPAPEPGADAAVEAESFAGNPCKSPAARFLSHCRPGQAVNK